MTKTAIAFTGGVDSTYLLHKLLNETDDQIVAFRLRVQSGAHNAVALAEAEDIAAPSVVAWLKSNTRDFDYRVVPVPAFRDGEWSSLECARVGGQMVRDGEADRFCIGRNAEAAYTIADLDADSGKKNVLRRQLEIFRAIAPGGLMEQPLKDANLGKVDAYFDLPAALLDLTAKCKNPSVVNGAINPCLACGTGCLLHAEISRLKSEGVGLVAIKDYIHKTRRHGAYVNLPLTGARNDEIRRKRYDALRQF